MGEVMYAPRLLDQVRARCQVRYPILRTRQVDMGWIRRFVVANGKRHAREMGGSKVETFLTALATRRGVAAAMQNQALAVLLFLYRDVPGLELPWMDAVIRVKRPRRVPVVLSARPSFAIHLLESGQDIRTIPALRGHKELATAPIYTQMLDRGGLGVRSPLDRIPG